MNLTTTEVLLLISGGRELNFFKVGRNWIISNMLQVKDDSESLQLLPGWKKPLIGKSVVSLLDVIDAVSQELLKNRNVYFDTEWKPISNLAAKVIK